MKRLEKQVNLGQITSTNVTFRRQKVPGIRLTLNVDRLNGTVY